MTNGTSNAIFGNKLHCLTVSRRRLDGDHFETKQMVGVFSSKPSSHTCDEGCFYSTSPNTPQLAVGGEGESRTLRSFSEVGLSATKNSADTS